VRTAADLAAPPGRRFSATGTAIMGAGPPLIDIRKSNIFKRNRRETFTQHKIRIEIAAGQNG